MKKALLVTAAVGAIALAGASSASASKGDIGTDTSVHNGYGVPIAYGKEKFNIAQVGGINNGYIYGQATYTSQMKSAIAQNKRAHTYMWLEGGSSAISNQLANTFLPTVAANAPKGSIVAVDYENNPSWNKQANTDAIKTLMYRIKQAGFTPMLYGYKGFLQANVYTDQVVREFGTCLWVAEYPNYAVTPWPNYNFFPSMNGIAMFQFTSTYVAAGLDGSVDLTGITDSGYAKQAPFVPNNSQANKNTHKEAKAKTVSFKGVYVADQWVSYNGKTYGLNYDMAKPTPIDYNQYMPIKDMVMTDRYGHKLNNQYIQGNNGKVEFFTLPGHYKILQRYGNYVKIQMNGEPVWLSANYVHFD